MSVSAAATAIQARQEVKRSVSEEELFAQGPAQVVTNMRVRFGGRPHLKRRLVQLGSLVDLLKGRCAQRLLGQGIGWQPPFFVVGACWLVD
jgi:hypothetical protein